MSNLLENLWVTWSNSDRWRRFAKHGVGAHLLRSGLAQDLHTTRRYITTYYKSRRDPTLFQDVRTFCLFVGHVKSGGTLIGSLLDAHPNIILADEADALFYVSTGFTKEQLFHILRKASHREAMKGRVTARRLTPYAFAVPGQWQGKHDHLHVIGDSKAGPSTRRLSQNPHLLAQLEQIMPTIQLKLFHVVRNPFDPISAMIIRGKRHFAAAIEHYFDYCLTLNHLHEQYDDSTLLMVRYEDLIQQPGAHLQKMCRFIDVEATDAYRNACINILHKSPEQIRQFVDWTPDWINVVEEKIDQISFLSGYKWSS